MVQWLETVIVYLLKKRTKIDQIAHNPIDFVDFRIGQSLLPFLPATACSSNLLRKILNAADLYTNPLRKMALASHGFHQDTSRKKY
jgi:hypothetical protein